MRSLTSKSSGIPKLKQLVIGANGGAEMVELGKLDAADRRYGHLVESLGEEMLAVAKDCFTVGIKIEIEI